MLNSESIKEKKICIYILKENGFLIFDFIIKNKKENQIFMHLKLFNLYITEENKLNGFKKVYKNNLLTSNFFLFFFIFFLLFFLFSPLFSFPHISLKFFLGTKLIVQTISEPFPFKKKHTHKWKCQIDVIFTIFNKWGLLFQIWRCNTLAQIFLNLFQEKFGNKLLNLYRPIKNWIAYSLTILDTKFRNEVWCR